MENQTQNQSEVQTEAQTGTKSIKIEDLKNYN
jgi:hypothetical protein